jgi:hypothetical protein
MEHTTALDAKRALPRPTLSDIRKVLRHHRNAFGRYPNLIRPRRFSEKMQWRKLFDLNPIYPDVTCKLAARDFITFRVRDAILPALLWTGDKAEQVPLETLDAPYVLKCSHGSGFNVIVQDRATLDVAAACEKLRRWLAVSYSDIHREPAYLPIKPRLLAERMLLEADGSPAVEHKVYVFDGKPRLIQSVVVDRARKRLDTFHDPDWRRIDWRLQNPIFAGELRRPPRLARMMAMAELLGAGFDHLRVDFYEWRGEPCVGELTLYNYAGLAEFKPEEAELLIGSWWVLKSPVRRALKAMFSF